MLIENKILSKEKWVQTFNHRFKSFCEKLPFYCEYNLIDNIVLLTIIESNDKRSVYEFTLNFAIDPKSVISNIKNKIIENDYYPVFKIEKQFKESFTAPEIKEMLDEGIELEDAMSRTKLIKKYVEYRVEKIHNLENNVSLRDLRNNKIILYKMKVPVIKFTEILNKNFEEAQEFFFKNSYIVNLKEN